MNPIPLSTPDGTILAWACSRCRVSANGRPADNGQAFAEDCGRCYACKAPAVEPTSERPCSIRECASCAWRHAWERTFEQIAEAIEYGITNEDVWYAWERDKRSDLR